MSREVRMVPADWEHPTNIWNKPIPLHGGSFTEALAQWNEENTKWQEGLRGDYKGGWKPIEDKYKGISFSEFDGDQPKRKDYMPEFAPRQCTHYQMYETCTEGTPISPVMSNPEDLAHWLADTEASAFGNMTATYEEWLATIQAGSSVASGVMVDGQMMSGVAAVKHLAEVKS